VRADVHGGIGELCSLARLPGSTVDKFQAIGDAHVFVRVDQVGGLIVDGSA
jgi:hypothetical protein